MQEKTNTISLHGYWLNNKKQCITCAICGRQRGLDNILLTLGVGVTISPASSKSECADTMLCNMDKAVSPT
jgi:hypothetical protein